MLNTATERDSGHGGGRAGRGRVLVVDDELAMVRIYARALTAEGFRVLCATDGPIAEMMFRRCKLDAVVSDIAMPGLDGLDLLRSLRAIDRDVPVILATGDHRDATAQRAVEEGAMMYVVKPVDLRALAQIVGHAAGLHRLAQALRASRASSDGAVEGGTTPPGLVHGRPQKDLNKPSVG